MKLCLFINRLKVSEYGLCSTSLYFGFLSHHENKVNDFVNKVTMGLNQNNRYLIAAVEFYLYPL